MKERGKLFVVEGGPGCGKTTKIEMFKNDLPDWSFYREPGDTPFGEALRVPLIEDRRLHPDPLASFFAFTAARANLMRKKVIPDLESGVNVALDRYWYSSWAYQGAEGVPKPIIYDVSSIATSEVEPNLVLYYDITPEIGKKQKEGLSDIDRYDLMKNEFHYQVRNNYRELGLRYPHIWREVDASRPLAEVYNESLDILREFGLLK